MHVSLAGRDGSGRIDFGSFDASRRRRINAIAGEVAAEEEEHYGDRGDCNNNAGYHTGAAAAVRGHNGRPPFRFSVVTWFAHFTISS